MTDHHTAPRARCGADSKADSAPVTAVGVVIGAPFPIRHSSAV
jgi:hypothetical protein